MLGKLAGDALEHLGGYVEVGVHRVDVVEIFERLDQAHELARLGATLAGGMREAVAALAGFAGRVAGGPQEPARKPESPARNPEPPAR